jgi:hypothetical protein
MGHFSAWEHTASRPIVWYLSDDEYQADLDGPLRGTVKLYGDRWGWTVSAGDHEEEGWADSEAEAKEAAEECSEEAISQYESFQESQYGY